MPEDNSEGKSGFKRKAASLVGAGLLAATGASVINEGSSVTAADNTPTPISTRTPTHTPNALETAVAKAQQEVKDLQKEKEAREKLANAQSTAESLKTQIAKESTPKPPPTKTPEPVPTRNITATAESLSAGFREGIKATATAKAEQKAKENTAILDIKQQTAINQAVRDAIRNENTRRGDQGGFPWGWLAAGTLGAIGAFAVARRDQVNGWRDRLLNWARQRFGGGGQLPAAPGQAQPPAVPGAAQGGGQPPAAPGPGAGP